MISLGMISAAVGTDKVETEVRQTMTPILFTTFPPGHGTGLEQLSSSDKHSQHHKMLLHPRLLIAAAMVILKGKWPTLCMPTHFRTRLATRSYTSSGRWKAEKSKLLRVSYSRSKLHLVPYTITLVFAVARGGRECDAPKWAFLPVSINLLPRNF